jgi:16S rRNA (uracil1498-N3)-methyltransferase
MTRIYHPAKIDTEVTLSPEASHHLATVLRMNPGEPLTLFNGDGNDYYATLTLSHKKNSQATIHKTSPNPTESSIHFHLIQGVCRGEKMDWIIQKAVELGVGSITPIITERTQGNKSLKDADLLAKKNQHYQQVIISACEQSGRARIPQLNPTLKFEEFLASQAKSPEESLIVLSPDPAPQASQNSFKNIHFSQKISFIVGPEGGLTEQEIHSALKIGYTALTLGPRVLRTETAALAFISAVQGKVGDF